MVERDSGGAAKRRCDRLLRMQGRHEQLSLRMAIAESQHHSALHHEQHTLRMVPATVEHHSHGAPRGQPPGPGQRSSRRSQRHDDRSLLCPQSPQARCSPRWNRLARRLLAVTRRNWDSDSCARTGDRSGISSSFLSGCRNGLLSPSKCFHMSVCNSSPPNKLCTASPSDPGAECRHRFCETRRFLSLLMRSLIRPKRLPSIRVPRRPAVPLICATVKRRPAETVSIHSRACLIRALSSSLLWRLLVRRPQELSYSPSGCWNLLCQCFQVAETSLIQSANRTSAKRRRRTRYTPLPGILENAVYQAPSAWPPVRRA